MSKTTYVTKRVTVVKTRTAAPKPAKPAPAPTAPTHRSVRIPDLAPVSPPAAQTAAATKPPKFNITHIDIRPGRTAVTIELGGAELTALMNLQLQVMAAASHV